MTQKPILENLDRPSLIKIVGIYLIVVGILTVCGGIALTLGGVFAGLAGALGSTIISEAPAAGVDAAEAAAATAALGGLGILVTCFGILSIVTGPAMIVVGIGNLNRWKWARMGTVVVGGLSLVSSLLGLLTGGGILNLVWAVVGGVVVYMYLTDPGIKAHFGDA